MKVALFYDRLDTKQVRCGLCRFNCLIESGGRGICNVRENCDGTLYSLVYDKLCSVSIDPIEKKPLFHVMPGSRSYSIATQGCNFRCKHCQNHTISQVTRETHIRGAGKSPQNIVQNAIEAKCRSISYTYTEPTIFYELSYDTACLAKETGLKNIFVTNAYISKQALQKIAPYLDAANIDLKSFSKDFYRDVVHANLSEVLDSIIEYRKQGVWIELTTLVIPGQNDSSSELRNIAEFIVSNLGIDTPWHLTRFHPAYQMSDLPPTTVATLRRARDIGKAVGLRYVYEGNIPGESGENTYCPSCSTILVKRNGFAIEENRIRTSTCPDCGTAIAGIDL